MAASRSIDLDTYVNESRIDRRLHRANWCNQAAGISEWSRINPTEHIDSYVWAWLPGLSDGASSQDTMDLQDENTWIPEPQCIPGESNTYDSNFLTRALPAPHRNRWNLDYFNILMENAYPPIE